MKDRISLSYCLRAAAFIFAICLVYAIYKLGRGIKYIRKAVAELERQREMKRTVPQPVEVHKLIKKQPELDLSPVGGTASQGAIPRQGLGRRRVK